MKVGIFCCFLIISILFLFALPNPAMADAPQVKIFIDEPLDETYLQAYPEVKEFFESDDRLVLVTEIKPSLKMKYPVSVQLYNPNGDNIYSEQKTCEVHGDLKKPFIYYDLILDNALKAKLSHGVITIKLSIDVKTYPATPITYQAFRFSKKDTKVIILPFYSSTNQFFDYKSKKAILNTFSDAIRLELKKYFIDIVPAHISQKSLSDLQIKGCLNNPECRGKLKTLFGEGVFITGDVAVPGSATRSPSNSLEILVFNTYTDSVQKVRFDFPVNYLASENNIETMKKLINNALFQQGFLDYMRAL